MTPTDLGVDLGESSVLIMLRGSLRTTSVEAVGYVVPTTEVGRPSATSVPTSVNGH